MKRVSSSMVTGALLFFTSITLAGATSFSDLPDTSTYSTSVSYLAEVGIIDGYPDGTFRPNQKVNRAEFLKLVLESSEIATDITTPTPFPDVDNGAWYAPYLRKAYTEGWIQGYPDGTFKPEQFINKVEALKIIGEVQQWQTETPTEKPFTDVGITGWFSPYVAYAKEKNFLEERTSLYFPQLLLSRAQISEVLFRSFITEKSGADMFDFSLADQYPASDFVIDGEKNDPPSAPPPVENEFVNFTPVPFGRYEPDFFEGVRLASEIPNHFYLNEVYFIEGTITSGGYEEIFVFLVPEGTINPDNYINYVSKVDGSSFSIPVIFRKAGNYKMGIIRGKSGESKIINISVMNTLPEIPATTNSTTPSQPDIVYKDQKTTFSWENEGLDIIALTVYQNNIAKEFIFRQGKEYFDIDYTDFINFQEGSTSYSFKGAELESHLPLEFETGWSESTPPTTFQAVEHNYSLLEESNVTINNLPETLSTTSPITFTGTAKSELFLEAAITKPDGFVELFNMSTSGTTGDFYGSKTVLPGNSFTYTYSPAQPGTYIIEINGTDGSAVLNTPVYVANGIPLIPDFFDLNTYTKVEQNFTLSNSREQLLNLINQERAGHGLSPVVADTTLNSLAQAHSEDMKSRDFFNHINPDGETPNDRRLAKGIPMPVGENLAIAPTTIYTHEGLMQSGIHRNNILNPDWTKVGIGIAVGPSGSLITTQEFSRNPYTQTELDAVESKIVSAINTKRTDSGLSVMQIGSDIQYVADQWSKKMAEQNFFDFTSPNGETLSELVSQHAPGKPVNAIILNSLNPEKLAKEGANENEVTNSQWSKIGVGVHHDSTGSLKTTVLFTTN